MARYRLTARRRAALRKAQAASARRRRGRNLVIGAGVVGAAVFGYKSGSRYMEARAFHKQVNGRKYGYREHLGVQARSRSKARKNFLKRVPAILKNTPIKTKIKGRRGDLYAKNPYVAMIDAKDGRKLKFRMAYRDLKHGYSNYYDFEGE